MRTFGFHLKQMERPAVAVAIHPGTIKASIKGFRNSASTSQLHEPEEAAERVLDTAGKLKEGQRGKVWDWVGKEVAW